LKKDWVKLGGLTLPLTWTTLEARDAVMTSMGETSTLKKSRKSEN